MEKHVIRLKEIMHEKGISRDKLAEAMKVAPATISNISTGKVYPSVKFLLELAEYLDVDIREMFYTTKGNVVTNFEIHQIKEAVNSIIEILNPQMK